jgi:Cysteine-rich secretory protein family/LysM domain
MTLRRLFFLTLFLLLPVSPIYAQDGGDLLARVNNLRASMNLPPYTLNGALSAAAQSQAQWMAETGSVSHNRPDGSGPRTRAVNAGYGTTDVSENIYGGTNATADTAWTFWVNSGVHYAGMINSRYQEVGIGVASGQLTTFVLVFGNPGGPAPFVPQTGAAGNNAGPSAPPSYVVGLDEHGNIKHEVQPDDTLGDIALIYGYTWDDIPYMKQLNGLTDNRALEIGSIFLVPPHDGTYTPVPGAENPTSTLDPNQPTETLTATPTAYPSATPSPTMPGIATSAAMPEAIVILVSPSPTDDATVVAAVSTPVALLASSTGTITRSGTSPWLAVALVVQVGLLTVAGFEFVRRSRRKR